MSDKPSHSRRDFLLKSLTLIPAVSVGGAITSGIAGTGSAQAAETSTAAPAAQTPYSPVFFKPDEWSFVKAACARLIPADEMGPGALEAGVPEFLDRHLQTPYANGSVWYTQGPFVEAGPEFGYQGRKTLSEIIRSGIRGVIGWTQSNKNQTFDALTHSEQEEILVALEKGKIHLEEMDAKTFFDYFLGEVRNGFFADPSYGGNKGMVGWKLIGFPGMRADYIDFITVRDKPYPLGPVDLVGNRG